MTDSPTSEETAKARAEYLERMRQRQADDDNVTITPPPPATPPKKDTP